MRVGTVLVTGGAGYLGRVLVPLLEGAGWRVRVVDLLWYGGPEGILAGDVRRPDRRWVRGVDAVVHLAGVSSDRLAVAAPELCWDVNAEGTRRLAALARAEGVTRFVHASTCSVYGLRGAVRLDEDAELQGVGAYAESKITAERALHALADERFRPVALRFGTLHGWSPRLRTDLVVNAMLRSALATGRIDVRAPRTWRPILHVTDAARAILRALSVTTLPRTVYNVSGRSYPVAAIGRAVAAVVAATGRGVSITTTDGATDGAAPTDGTGGQMLRSYRVSGARAARDLGFFPRLALGPGAADSLRRLPDPTDWAEAARFNATHLDRLLGDARTLRRVSDVA